MLPRQLVTCSLLALSIASVSFFSNTLSVQAGEGKCGDSFVPCNETQSPRQPTVSIKYTITNKTDKTVKFGLPSGKTYQLAPGQRGSYKNTVTADRLRIFILGENKFYPLNNGNYQLRQSSSGQIKLVRIQTRQKTRTPATRSTVPLINRISLKTPFLGTESPIVQQNPIVSEPNIEEPNVEEQEQGIQEAEPAPNSSSNSIFSEVVQEIGEIVRTAITADAATDQKRIEYSNNQSTTTTNPLPETPPQITKTEESVDQILAKWGWTKVSCAVAEPVVVITGLGDGDVCVNSTQEMPAGKYEYNRTSHQLSPLTQQ